MCGDSVLSSVPSVSSLVELPSVDFVVDLADEEEGVVRLWRGLPVAAVLSCSRSIGRLAASFALLRFRDLDLLGGR